MMDQQLRFCKKNSIKILKCSQKCKVVLYVLFRNNFKNVLRSHDIEPSTTIAKFNFSKKIEHCKKYM